MKFFLLDVYKNRGFRVSKDINGGYGAGNDFGHAILPLILTKIKKITTDFPPLSLAYIAASLKAKGHEVAYGKNADPPKDSDIVLLSSSIVEYSTELEWGKRLKENGFHVGYIGPFANIMIKNYLEAGHFVISGEPELFFLNNSLSRELLTGKIGSDAFACNLDSLPFPDWSCFNTFNMKYSLYGGGGRFLPMLASRGCPYPCRYYCTYPIEQGQAIRSRSAKNVVDEMEHLRKNYLVKTILFRDTNFTICKEKTAAFLEELIRRKLGMKFVIETHLDTLDIKFIDKFRQAGLTTIKVGVEAPNQDILAKNKRAGMVKDLQRNIIKAFEQAGIRVICFYILGFSQDTWESCIETIRYARMLNTAGAQFSVCTPYPGTAFYEAMKDKIVAKRFDDFTQFSLVYKHDNLTPRQIEELKNIAYTTYYLRLSWIIKYITMRVFS